MDPPPAPSKLRLMCSYGGHITPRPLTKSLYYAGGETRLISIPDTATLTLSSLINHLASTLHITNYPFTLKYQLPNHDLDSLISLSTDEDFLLMLDKLHRLSSSPSRIRLFLFPSSHLSGNELRHPMTETWFADVLKSAKLMQKGGVGFGAEVQVEGNNSGGEVNGGLCGAESMVLETGSSLGSSSSAVSFPYLPAKGQFEDHTKFPPSDAIARDNTIDNAASHPQIGTYHDTVAPENKNYIAPLESETKMFDPEIGIEMHRTVQVSGIPVPFQYEQSQVQFVHTAAPHYVAQNPTDAGLMSPYYLMGSPMPQQQMYYQTNHPPPVYFVPVGHPYRLPVQNSLITPAAISSNRPPPHPNPSSAQVAYKVAADSLVPEMAPQGYKTKQMATTHVNLPHTANHQHAGVNIQAHSIGITSPETAYYTNDLLDDVVHAQIYKSQPPDPALLSQFQTMTKAMAGVMVSDALAQLQIENTNQ